MMLLLILCLSIVVAVNVAVILDMIHPALYMVTNCFFLGFINNMR